MGRKKIDLNAASTRAPLHSPLKAYWEWSGSGADRRCSACKYTPSKGKLLGSKCERCGAEMTERWELKMRENMGLYHGKRSDNGKWVEGYFFETNTPVYRAFIITNMSVDITDGCTDILDFNIVEVDPETVGEFTGLTDKNGKRIFEGDIVKYGDTVHKVVFENRNKTAYFGLVYSPLETLPFGHYQDLRQIEIIGNIHDNPELLKGGENND